MRTRRAAVVAILILGAAGVSAGGPAALVAASPSPSPAPASTPSPSPSASASASIVPDEERPPEQPHIEAWLDRPLPADPTGDLDVGVTLWDAAGGIPTMGATLFIQAVPPKGGGDPVRATAIRDWRGHYRGSVGVPAGGLDHLEVGVSGTACENDVCHPDDWLFDVAGVGPPPLALLTDLSEARIDVGDAAVTAGRPADVDVIVTPNADWESLPLPPEIVLRARVPRGPNVATAALQLVDATGGLYRGSITIPEAGDLVLEAALDEDGGDATRFGTSMMPIPVGAGTSGAAADEPGSPVGPDQAGDEGLPTIVIVLLGVAAIAGLGVMLAGFRSGGR
jgi:hypothetical protein